ncbi:hypothetical protein HKD37_09G025345 [Glycine soja]
MCNDSGSMPASIFRYDRRICEWLCSSKRHRCHNPQSPQRRFRLHARKLLRTSFYRNTFTSIFSAMTEEFVNGFVHQNSIAAILAPCPQVAEDEFLPQHIHLKRFRLHARKLLRTSFYRNTFTSIFFAMAEEFVNGFVHQNGITVITHNPPKGDGEKKTKIWIILVVVVGLICLGIHIFLVWRCYTLFFNIDFYILSLPFYLPAISSAFGYNNNSEIPFRTAVRPTILYGTECWTVKSQHENKVGVAEIRMLRKTRQDKIRNEAIRERVGVAPIVEKMVENRLRWFGHVERRPVDSVVRRVD